MSSVDYVATQHQRSRSGFEMTSKLIQEKISLHSEHKITHSGTLHGFIGWFNAHLYGNTFLSNNPLKKNTPFNWTQAFFPLPEIHKKTIHVKRNQSISFSIDWDLAAHQLQWHYYI